MLRVEDERGEQAGSAGDATVAHLWGKFCGQGDRLHSIARVSGWYEQRLWDDVQAKRQSERRIWETREHGYDVVAMSRPQTAKKGLEKSTLLPTLLLKIGRVCNATNTDLFRALWGATVMCAQWC